MSDKEVIIIQMNKQRNKTKLKKKSPALLKANQSLLGPELSK